VHGFNPAAVVALALGCAVYMGLLNPLTFASSGPYKFLTASLPAALCAGVAYVVDRACTGVTRAAAAAG